VTVRNGTYMRKSRIGKVSSNTPNPAAGVA
jgi:hypothetical protein